MLIAAMILGLIGGVLYFIGGCAWATVGEPIQADGANWWVYPMIPIGIVGIIGSALILSKPNLLVFQRFPVSAVLLLLACVSAIVIGIVSYEDAIGDGPVYSSTLLGTQHYFSGGLPYAPMPLLTLVTATALNIAGRKRGEQENLTTP